MFDGDFFGIQRRNNNRYCIFTISKKYYLFGQFQFLNIKKVENLRMFNVYGFDICFNNKSHLIDEKKYEHLHVDNEGKDLMCLYVLIENTYFID